MSSREIEEAEDSRADEQIAAMEGELSLPRQNGELVFSKPWEARAFGVAVALNEAGLYPWQSFSSQLADEIAGARGSEEADDYYGRWLGALEALIEREGLVGAEELEGRVQEYVSGERNDDDH